MAISLIANLSALEEFFGVPAELEYSGIPVHMNNMEFSTDLENVSVWLKLIGSQHRGELRLVGKPFSIVKLTLVDISRVAVRKTPEDHFMCISFARADTDDLTLWLRPKVFLSWGNGAAPKKRGRQELQPVQNPK